MLDYKILINFSQARASIERIIANEGSGPPRMGGGGGGPGGHMGGGGGGMSGGGCFEMSVPGHKVGLIIGKGGETIKQLQERSGAKIIIIQDSAELANEKPLRITVRYILKIALFVSLFWFFPRKLITL